MFKLEIELKNTLPLNELNDMYKKFDSIFMKRDLLCAEKGDNKSVYVDKNGSKDYGNFWGAIFRIKDSKELSDSLTRCQWYNGNPESDDLIKSFMSVQV